jgi:hypothetical protein
MQHIVITLFIVLFPFSSTLPVQIKANDRNDIRRLWRDCSLEKVVSYEIFNLALTGFNKTENIKKRDILTIIDYSRPSTEKRFFVIDLKNKKLLYNCLVAHGKNTGENIAESFSNKAESLQSSLGFFITAETYTGENGYSLKLDGIEKNINDNARPREIVIHGAAYVSQQFIDENGRLGRSWGCPALPVDISKEVIDRISDGSCIFIYANDKFYKKNTTLAR